MEFLSFFLFFFFYYSLFHPLKSALNISNTDVDGDGDCGNCSGSGSGKGDGGFIAQANRFFRHDLPSMNDYENHDYHAETVTKLQQLVVCRLGIKKLLQILAVYFSLLFLILILIFDHLHAYINLLFIILFVIEIIYRLFLVT